VIFVNQWTYQLVEASQCVGAVLGDQWCHMFWQFCGAHRNCWYMWADSDNMSDCCWLVTLKQYNSRSDHYLHFIFQICTSTCENTQTLILYWEYNPPFTSRQRKHAHSQPVRLRALYSWLTVHRADQQVNSFQGRVSHTKSCVWRWGCKATEQMKNRTHRLGLRLLKRLTCTPLIQLRGDKITF